LQTNPDPVQQVKKSGKADDNGGSYFRHMNYTKGVFAKLAE
jgi:hypothetical protein